MSTNSQKEIVAAVRVCVRAGIVTETEAQRALTSLPGENKGLHEMSADMMATLRGQDFIDAIRKVHAESRQHGAHVRCGGEGCTNPAVWVGMQTCGAPGGPVCELHRQRHIEWMAMSANLGQPYCRHCGRDVDASHIYVVPLDAEGQTK